MMRSTVSTWTRFMKSWSTNRHCAVWTVSILAFLIRLATSFALRTYNFNPAHDHWAFGYEWGRIAKWLVESNMFSMDGSSPYTFTDPIYVFVIALVFYVFGTFTTHAAIALIVFQSLLCGLTAWAIFVLGEKIYGPFEARMASLLFAFYPASIFFAVGRIAPSSLTILLLCLIFLVVLRIPESPRPGLAVFGGFLMGLLLLTSSKPLSLLLVIPVWLLLVAKRQRVRMIMVSLIFIGSAMLVVVPWAVRNSIVLGQASLSKSTVGVELRVGNNPGATGYNHHMPRGVRFDPGDPHLQMAISWIVHNKRDFAILTLKRIKYFWYRIPRVGGKGDLLNTWVFMTVLGLAMLGAFWSGEMIERVGLLLLYFAIFPILFYVTHVAFYRHRFHVEPFILILASHGLHRLWTMFLNRKTKNTIAEQRIRQYVT